MATVQTTTLEVHFVLDAQNVPREAFALRRFLYLNEDGTEFAPPRTERVEITIEAAREVIDSSALLAVEEARSLALQLAAERDQWTTERAALVEQVNTRDAALMAERHRSGG